MSFAEIADRRLLTSVADHLGELIRDVEPDGYQRLKVPSSAPVDPILRLLLRRGLEPALAGLLLDRFAERPLERALIAWDIAAGSLLGRDDGALRERLPEALAPLVQLGTTPAVAVPRERVAALIEAAVAEGDRPLPEDSAPLPSLASVVALEADTVGVEEAHAFSEKLALAHLPSLALAFDQILWTRLAAPRAMDHMLEVALDYERLESLPEMSATEARSVQRQTYLAVRLSLAQLDTGAAERWLEELGKHPANVGSSDPALAVALAELDLLSDRPIDYARSDQLDALAPGNSTWRYVSRVCYSNRIVKAPSDAAIWVDSFLTSFGNDMRMWAHAALHKQDCPELVSMVSREVQYCSWDPEAWRALATMFLDDGMPVELELQQRSAAQLEAALGLP